MITAKDGSGNSSGVDRGRSDSSSYNNNNNMDSVISAAK